MISTGTASGKWLAYLLPSSPRCWRRASGPGAVSVADQGARRRPDRALAALGLAGVRAACFDGDTPYPERDWIRSTPTPADQPRPAAPEPAAAAPALGALPAPASVVVIDECHRYRGLFGRNVSLVLRRLRRLCALYGAAPVFVLASATSAAPGESAGRLVGLPVRTVEEDGSPRGSEPSRCGNRRWRLGRLARRRDRRNRRARRPAPGADPAGGRCRGRPATGRPGDRRRPDAGVRPVPARCGADRAGPPSGTWPRRAPRNWPSGSRPTGAVPGGPNAGRWNARWPTASCSGWRPPTRWSSAWTSPAWTRWCWPAIPARWPRCGSRPAGRPARPGRAGGVRRPRRPAGHLPGQQPGGHLRPARRGQRHRSDQSARARPATVLRGRRTRPDRPPTRSCSAARRPSRRWPRWSSRACCAAGRPAGSGPTAAARAADLRGVGQPVSVVEAASGSLLGTVDFSTAPATVHPQAVYLHQGNSYLVEELDLEQPRGAGAGRGAAVDHHRAGGHRHQESWPPSRAPSWTGSACTWARSRCSTRW